ncbi:hypothetical protein [Actinacidiphila bryophytorum]|uniref:hypothetical protein n=1 Tax=Actinacidiphila bryophytorum TaxID=1436133 RepID=UPI002176BC36|nr:hypothetical protein [Actinacidiphila bryophytorum]UWE13374.1 hypothetical protein NYE86_35010 [Actinacidiphila bryophytorum]
MWPQILDAVKNRRRLTWMLLFNNAQVSGFDGETLQVGFDNPGARNSFANSGSEDVLKQAINDALGVQWRIEAIVDPSGGGGPGGLGGPGGGGGSPRPPAPPQSPAAPQAYGGGGPAGPDAYGSAQTAPQTHTQAQARPGGVQNVQSSPGGSGTATATAAPPGPRSAPADAPRQERRYTDEVPPPPIEDDIPEDDDPDLVDSALSGHDLFIRELGATVIEEIQHD